MPEPTILDRIVAQRRVDVAAAKQAIPAHELRSRLNAAPPALSFAARLRAAAPMAVIAEIKRASPSKGDIAPGIDAAEQGLRYARAGAAGISVLTEPTWFKGTLEDMAGVRTAIDPLGAARPALLRKDFIVDEYQLLEARVSGADAVLLIVAALSDSELRALYARTSELGMEALVEVDNAEGMARAVDLGAAIIGVNNRDLRTFNVELATTDRLAALVPPGTLLAALSGISSRADVERFAAAGAEAVLVGEALMLAPEPALKIAELRGVQPAVPRMTQLYVVQMHGVPGSGKSTIARQIGRQLPAVVLDVDIIKTALLTTGQAPGSVGPPAGEVLWDVARSLLGQGYSVVADAPCGWPIVELKGKGVASATGATYRMVECTCIDQDELALRLATREALPTQPREIFDWGSRPGAAEPTSERVVLDCRGPLEPLVADALAHIRGMPVVGSSRWHRGATSDWTGRPEKVAANRGIWSGQP